MRFVEDYLVYKCRKPDTINYAKHIFYDKKREWNKIIDRGMLTDYSWTNSAGKYQQLYSRLLGR